MQIICILNGDLKQPLIQNIDEFLGMVDTMKVAGETQTQTVKRALHSLMVSYDRSFLHLICNGHPVRQKELDLLLNIKQGESFDPKNAEILGNRILADGNPAYLPPYNVSIRLTDMYLDQTSLAHLVYIMRAPEYRNRITGVEFDEAMFSDLRCEYGIGDQAECGPFADLLRQPDLFGQLSYLYITHHREGRTLKYMVIRPAGEFFGVGASEFCGGIGKIKVNIVPGTNRNELLMPGPGSIDTLTSFEGAISALRSPYALEFFHSNQIDIERFLSEHGIKLMMEAGNGAYAGINGPSGGVATFVAICSAITGKSIHPDVGFTGVMRQDGSVGDVGGVPTKARKVFNAGYQRFGVPRISMNRDFNRWPFHSLRYPKLEPGDGLVRRVRHSVCEVHAIRGVADVLKLAFGFETGLDPNRQRMSWSFLMENIRRDPVCLDHFLYERGLFEQRIENSDQSNPSLMLRRISCLWGGRS